LGLSQPFRIVGAVKLTYFSVVSVTDILWSAKLPTSRMSAESAFGEQNELDYIFAKSKYSDLKLISVFST
jgi:hypothetical protein